jgi:hypothetical protein
MALGACSGDGTAAKATPSVPLNVTPGASATPGLGNAGVFPTGNSPPPPCDQPAPIARPSWVPEDLPMPDGTYLYKNYGYEGGYQRGLFVVPGSLNGFATFVLDKWPKAGWILGRGDSEANEVETSFSKPPAFGAFKAAGQFCTPGYNILLLVFVTDREAVLGNLGGSPTPTPSTSPS